jgi:acyl carrier protein
LPSSPTTGVVRRPVPRVGSNASVAWVIEPAAEQIMANPDPHYGRQQRGLLLAAFVRAAAAVTSTKLDHISEATPLSELVIDSLAMVEILGELEQHLEVDPIPDEFLPALLTVGDLLDVFEAQLARRAATRCVGSG